MILDYQFKFDVTPKNLSAGTADQLSTNVYDAGAAVNLFTGYTRLPTYLHFSYKCTAGSGTQSIRCQFVGSDAAALNSNNIIIADTGTVLVDDDDATAITSTHAVVNRVLPLVGQKIAKRYYGCIYTQGAADQDGECTAVITPDGQSALHYGRKQAVPAAGYTLGT